MNPANAAIGWATATRRLATEATARPFRRLWATAATSARPAKAVDSAGPLAEAAGIAAIYRAPKRTHTLPLFTCPVIETRAVNGKLTFLRE